MKNLNFTSLKTLSKISLVFILMFAFGLFTMAQDMQLTKVINQSNNHTQANGMLTVLYSQIDLGGIGISSQDFEASFDTFDTQGVDDFVVPTGDGWDIGSIMVFGGNDNVPFDLVNVEFFADAGGIPSATATSSFMAIAATDDGNGNLTIQLPLHLAPGHYWMSVQAANPFSTHGQWFWQPVVTVNNTISHWRNPGDGFGTGFTTWTPEDIAFGPPAEDLAFVLYEAPAPIPVSNWAIFLGVFLIAAFMVIRYRRRMFA